MSLLPSPVDLASANAPTSSAPGSSALTGPSPIDTNLIEKNKQQIDNWQSVSSSPSLPNVVKLDLASHSAFSSSPIADFLHGLDADLQTSTASPVLSPDQPKLVVPGQGQQSSTPITDSMLFHPSDDLEAQFQKDFASLAGINAPRRVSDDSVMSLKQQALERGLITPDTKIDGTWGPQWNGVRSKLMSADFQDVLAGDRFGSEPVGNAAKETGLMGMMNKWLSPSGLVNAAVHLDFIPDLEKTQNDWSHWWQHKTSFSAFAHAFSDVAFPILNTALLFTGVGEAVTFARGAMIGADALEAGALAGEGFSALGGLSGAAAKSGGLLGRIGDFGFADSAANVASDFGRMTEQSGLATRLGNITNPYIKPLAGPVSDGLEGWRSNAAVASTKKLIASGMKVGFAGRVEGALEPGRDLGYGLDGSTGGTLDSRTAGFQDWVNQKLSNPALQGLYGVMETALTPTTIFRPGAIIGPLRDTMNKVTSAVTELPQERELGSMLVNAVVPWLETVNPAKAAEVAAAAKGADSDKALALAFGGAPTLDAVNDVHKAQAGDRITYLVNSAGLNAYAEKEAAVVLDPSVVGEARARVETGFRNQAINQVRDQSAIDINTDEGKDAWRAMHSKIVASDEAPLAVAAQRKQIWNDSAPILDELHPKHDYWMALAQDELSHHQDVAKGTLTDIYNAVTPEHVTRVLYDAMPTLDNWEAYDSGMRHLDETLGFTPQGNSLITDARDVHLGDWLHPELQQDIQRMVASPQFTGTDPNLPRNPNLPDFFDNAKNQLADGRGRHTLGLINGGKPSIQEAANFTSQIQWVQAQKTALGEVGLSGIPALTELHGQSLADFATNAGKDVADLTTTDIDRWIEQDPGVWSKGSPTGTTTPTNVASDWAQAHVWAANHGDPTDALTLVNQRLDALNQSDFWGRSGVSAWSGGKNLTIDEKIDVLRRRMEFLAKDVTVPDELASRLAATGPGYKVVFGSEFATPHDLKDLGGPMPEIHRGDLFRKSLGTFIGKNPGMYAAQSAIRSQKLADLLPGAFDDQRRIIAAQGGDPVAELGQWGATFGTDPTDIDSFKSDLFKNARSLHETLDDTVRRADQAGLLPGIASRAASTGMSASPYRMTPKTLEGIFGTSFSDRTYKTLVATLQKAADTGFENSGLQSLESKVISNSWVRSALNGMQFHAAGTDIADSARALSSATDPALVNEPLVAGHRWLDSIVQQQSYSRRGLNMALGAAGGALIDGKAQDDPSATGIATGALGGAAAAGLFGLTGVVNPRNVISAYAGLQAQKAVADQGGGGLAQGGAAALGFLGGQAASNFVGQRGTSFLDSIGWADYSKLGFQARNLRDTMRFGLNPLFDARRYTQDALRSATAENIGVTNAAGEFTQAVQPLTFRPVTRYLSDMEKDGLPVVFNGTDRLGNKITLTGQDAMRARYRADLRGPENFDALDGLSGFSSEQGLLHFSPEDAQAAHYGQLLRQGVDPSQAMDAVQTAYGYANRSALEQSANFVLFPFSFQKKMLGGLANFVADDLGRATMIHDGMKVWDTLNQQEDLPSLWADHLPVMLELKRLNPLEFGVGSGQLGGINRGIYEAVKRVGHVGPVQVPLNEVHDAIANAFLPQAWSVHTADGGDELMKKVQQLIPVWGEAQDMMDKANSTNYAAVSSPNHLSIESEVKQGWAQNGALQTAINKTLKDNGLTYGEVINAKPDTAEYEVKQQIVASRQALETQYPQWAQAKADANQKALERNANLQKILVNPQSPSDFATVQFQDQIKQMSDALGYPIDKNADQLSPEAFDAIRKYAIGLARSTPGFLTSYNANFQRLYGPIEKSI